MIQARPSTAGIDRLERQRLDLLRAQTVLQDLGPVDFVALANPGDDTPDPVTGLVPAIAHDILTYVPELACDCRVCGLLTDPPTPDALFKLLDASLYLYEVQPRLICWPFVVPVLKPQGNSLLDYPQILVRPGDTAYLTAQWTWTANGLGCTAPAIFFDADPQLQAQNNLGPYQPEGDTRTWTFAIGNVNADGTITTYNIDNLPYIPPPLL